MQAVRFRLSKISHYYRILKHVIEDLVDKTINDAHSSAVLDKFVKDMNDIAAIFSDPSVACTVAQLDSLFSSLKNQKLPGYQEELARILLKLENCDTESQLKIVY